MQIEEPTTRRYATFLLTELQPLLKLWSELVLSAGGLTLLAFITGGAGYLLTDGMLPARDAASANMAELATTDQPQETEESGSGVVHTSTSNAAEVDMLISERLRTALRMAHPLDFDPGQREPSNSGIND